MKLPLCWLRDFVDIGDITPKEYSDALTMTGSKVEGIEDTGADIENVVVGKILDVAKHPNADSLWICKVDIGKVIQVVTGATNVKAGDLVPVAKDGARLPGGVKIKSGKLRGEVSEGMMCSHKELGLDFDDIPGACEDGILVFQSEYPVGMDVKEILGLGDTVIEFEITSNRPDCLSVIGLARESAVSLGKPLRLPSPSFKENSENISDYVSITVKDGELCPRYCARVVKNVKIGPSPLWMRARLKAAGIRPINNIVDITNYVCLEYGQPMHAFDLRDLEGRKIIVRRAEENETITTLDGEERKLTPDMLVIADERRAVAVAGVMGGENSGIKEDTNTILFESANFLGSSVRTTSKKLGLRTESSSRFEKGLDPENVLPALERACQLVEELGAGEIVGGYIDIDNSDKSPRVIKLRPDKINAFLGTDINADFMLGTLESLGFGIERDKMEITVPSFRRDVEGEADIAEEIARIYGYDRIPPTLLRGETGVGGKTYTQKIEDIVKQTMTALGYYEVMTYSFANPKSLDMINADESLRKVIRILNPLGEENSIMRTNMLSSMLEVLSRNFSRKNKEARIFEIGTVYIPKSLPLEELPEERRVLSLGAYGNVDFYDVKGAIEELFDRLGIKNYSFDTSESFGAYHPGRCADIFIGRSKVGMAGEIHPSVLSEYEIETRAYAAEIDFESVAGASNFEHKYTPLAKYPSVERDIALLVDDGVKAAQMEGVIKRCAGKLLEELKLFDIYKGKQVPEGKKSVAYSIVFRASDRTLNEEEINELIDKIVKALTHEVGAQLRL